jgi:DNA-binding beta-propeller fold protein YncE
MRSCNILLCIVAADAILCAQNLPNTGQQITPTAPPNTRFEPLNPGLADFPEYAAGQAVTTITSPNHNTLLILTSGYNLMYTASGSKEGTESTSDSREYVFVYDISHGSPVKQQVLQVPNTYQGIVFDPGGKTFYVSGGVDDNVHIFDLAGAGWSERKGSPISLGHSNAGCKLLGCGNGLTVSPEASGLAISGDGATLVVANYYNDSVSLLTNSSTGWTKSAELDLRPGKIDPANQGVPGGEYPLWVVMKGNATAYISSLRDREIDVVNVAGTPSVSARIPLKGQPNRMTLNAAQTLLYVAQDESDSVAVISTTSNSLISDIPAGPPARLLAAAHAKLTGNNTNSVTLSPDQQTLYVTNGNTNNVAVIELAPESGTPHVTGMIPTGWYPNSVSLSGDGKYMYVVNGKSPTGPNPGYCYGGIVASKTAAICKGSNEYDLQLIKAGFQSFPVPAPDELIPLTRQVAANNNFGRIVPTADQLTMAALRSKIQHVIYIIKENRTYDQILGDLEVGNGDPDLTEFGQATTPNLHSLARTFVTLDNFYDRSEVSMDGWPWSVSARAPDVVEKQVTVNYAGRGLSNDSEGLVRDINVSIPTLAGRLQVNAITPNDPDLLPGTADTSAPDGPDNEINTGYIWDAALRAGLSIRNYGFFIDLVRYNTPAIFSQLSIPLLPDPASSNTVVAYPANAALAPYTDPYFRGFDNSFPDYYRFTEWQRDFNTNYASGGLPQLSLVRFMHDHTGNYSTAIAGVNTPELQQADNDYAVGLLVQTIANSQYKDNTLIFVIEDDSQDGGDHVDAHRSIAFIVGPYVKQGAVVSTSYNTVDFVRTIEEVLGLGPLNMNDALAAPMADVFDLNQADWSFTATPSAMLMNTTLPITFPSGMKRGPRPTHDAAYWSKATAGMDFSAEDRMDFDQYNHILWQGLMGAKSYPDEPTGKDLRRNREQLLNSYRQSHP